MGSWNDFLGPLIFIADQRIYSLTFGLYAFAVQISNSPVVHHPWQHAAKVAPQGGADHRILRLVRVRVPHAEPFILANPELTSRLLLSPAQRAISLEPHRQREMRPGRQV